MTIDIGLSPALIEQVEAEAFADAEGAVPEPARTALGPRQLRLGGGVALAMPGDQSGFWSRALGLGFDEPVTADLVARVVEFYKEQGMSSANLAFAPEVLPPDWPDICARFNIARAASAEVKLAGDIEAVVEAASASRLDPDLLVVPVDSQLARQWAQMTIEVFGLPAAHQVDMFIATVGRPGWHPFAVIEYGVIVAGGSLYVHGDAGVLYCGATLPLARRRGAQSALIAARAKAARDAGCSWLIGGVAAEGPGEHNPSLHNQLRAGLSVRYERPEWTWRG
jgi:GNAT superfamily N-acetyltransferase